MQPGDEANGPVGGGYGESGETQGSDTWEPGQPETGGRGDQSARAKETAQRWIGQLQQMIDQVGQQAGPVLRDVAAKAAELTAAAAENAGPIAHKAAAVTEHVGDRLAVRSKELAADLRRAAEADAHAHEAGGEPDLGGGTTTTGESTGPADDPFANP